MFMVHEFVDEALTHRPKPSTRALRGQSTFDCGSEPGQCTAVPITGAGFPVHSQHVFGVIGWAVGRSSIRVFNLLFFRNGETKYIYRLVYRLVDSAVFSNKCTNQQIHSACLQACLERRNYLWAGQPTRIQTRRSHITSTLRRGSQDGKSLHPPALQNRQLLPALQRKRSSEQRRQYLWRRPLHCQPEPLHTRRAAQPAHQQSKDRGSTAS